MTATSGSTASGAATAGPAAPRHSGRPGPCTPSRPPGRGRTAPLLRIGVATLGGGRLGHDVLLALLERCPATAAGLTLAPPRLMWAMLRGGDVDAVIVDGTVAAPAGTRVAAVAGGPPVVSAVVAEGCPPAARLVVRHLVRDLGWSSAPGSGRG
jgi:hypothetical protein